MTRSELAEEIYVRTVSQYMFDSSPGIRGDYFNEQLDQFAEASIVAAKVFSKAASGKELV